MGTHWLWVVELEGWEELRRFEGGWRGLRVEEFWAVGIACEEVELEMDVGGAGALLSSRILSSSRDESTGRTLVATDWMQDNARSALDM